MAVKIVREDGSSEALSPVLLKRAIRNACDKAEISDYYEKHFETEVAQKVFKELKGEKEIKSRELRQRILTELENVERVAGEIARGVKGLDEEELI